MLPDAPSFGPSSLEQDGQQHQLSKNHIFWVIPNYRSDETSAEIKPLTPGAKMEVAFDDSFGCGAQEFCPQGLSLRNNAPKAHNPSFLEIIVGQESAVVVSFQPMIEVNLVEVRRDHLFSQFMSLRT